MSSRPKLIYMGEALAERVGKEVCLTYMSGQEVRCRLVMANRDAECIVIQQDGAEVIVRQDYVATVRTVNQQTLAAA